MALRKKLRPRKRTRAGKRKQHPMRLSAHQIGSIDGFQRGKEEGFAQGRAEAQKNSQNAVAVIETPLPKTDVLVIAAGMIPSLEIGVIQPLQALNKQENLKFDVKLETDVTHEMIAAANTIIFVRNVEPAAYALLELAHQLKKRTVYVIDDNFLEIQPTTPVGEYYKDPTRRETFIKFLKNTQIIKVDAPDLGSYIHERYNRHVIYFPASIDFEWLDQHGKADKNKEQVVIGYAGGDKRGGFRACYFGAQSNSGLLRGICKIGVFRLSATITG